MEVENGGNEATVTYGKKLYTYIYIFFRFKQFQGSIFARPGIYYQGYIALVTFVSEKGCKWAFHFG